MIQSKSTFTLRSTLTPRNFWEKVGELRGTFILRSTFTSALCLVFYAALLLLPRGLAAQTKDKDAQSLLFPLLLSIPGLDDGVIYGLAGGGADLGEGDYTLVAAAAGGGVQGGGIALMGAGLSIFAASVGSSTLINSFTRGLDDAAFVRQKLSGYGLGINYEQKLTSFLSLNWGTIYSELNFDSYENLDGEEIIPAGKIRSITTLVPSLGFAFDFTDGKPLPVSGAKFNLDMDYLLPDKTSLGTQLTLSLAYTQYIPIGTPLLNLILGVRRSSASIAQESIYDTPESISEVFLSPLCDEGVMQDSQKKQECKELEQQIIDTTLATNEHGISTPVGGVGGGRGFTLFRFKAAHTALEVLELRWNISATFSKKPNVPVYAVLFHDWAHASDIPEELYDKSANSYGGGFMAFLEGISLRLEYAQSKEDSFVYLSVGSSW